MWQQTYTPIAHSLPLSTLVAALPIFTLLTLLGVLRKPAWVAALCGLAAAALVAAGVYGMPMPLVLGSVAYGAAFGLFPIGWVVFSAILLYRVTLESGKFEVLKDSIGHLTADPKLQALLIAFAFGAFIEGAAGFGTPVAVAAAMLTGLGFEPFYAAAICLLANTAPVAFGSIAIPITTIRMASTLARTGRRMKKSEIMIAGRYLAAPAAGAGGAAMVCICGSTFWPGIARRIPATTTRSPLSIPLSIARRSPTLGPIVTLRCSTTLSLLTIRR